MNPLPTPFNLLLFSAELFAQKDFSIDEMVWLRGSYYYHDLEIKKNKANL